MLAPTRPSPPPFPASASPQATGRRPARAGAHRPGAVPAAPGTHAARPPGDPASDTDPPSSLLPPARPARGLGCPPRHRRPTTPPLQASPTPPAAEPGTAGGRARGEPGVAPTEPAMPGGPGAPARPPRAGCAAGPPTAGP